MKKIFATIFFLMLSAASFAIGVGGSGMYQWSVELTGYISPETGKAIATSYRAEWKLTSLPARTE